MSRGVQAFKQGDARKALQATRNAGFEPQRLEIGRDGKIVVIIKRDGVTSDEILDAAALIG